MENNNLISYVWYLSALIYNYPYILTVVFILVGLYLILNGVSLLKKIIGLNLIQTGVIIFYILAAYIHKSNPPILTNKGTNIDLVSNPVPQVLMLTAIVVGIATTALGYALLYKIYLNYGTLQEDRLSEKLKNK